MVKGHTKACVSRNDATDTKPAPAQGRLEDSDWTRLPKPGQSLRGLSRSYLHILCASGEIRSVTIRQKGKSRGVRLLSLSSLDSYLAALDREQNGSRVMDETTDEEVHL